MSDEAAVTGSVRHRKAQAIKAIRSMNLIIPEIPLDDLAKDISKRFPGLWTESKIIQLVIDLRNNRLPATEDTQSSLINTPVCSSQAEQSTPHEVNSSNHKTPAKEPGRKGSAARPLQPPVLGATTSAQPASYPDVTDQIYRNFITLGLELANLERSYLLLKYDANRMFAPPRAQQSYGGSLQCVAHYEKQRILATIKEQLSDLESRLRGKLLPKDRAIYTAQYNATALKYKSLLAELDVISFQAEEDGVLRRQISTYCLSNYYNHVPLPVLFPMNGDVTLQNYKTVKLPPVSSAARPRYLLMKKLGSGGFSTVYKALDLSTCLVVALKISRKESPREGDDQNTEDKRWLFLNREAEIYHLLKHQNIVQLNSKPLFVNSTTGRVVLNPAYEPYDEIALSMELCSGGDLHDFLALLCRSDKQARTEHELLTILLQIAEALKYLHTLKAPITHNDISLRNILLAEDGIWKLSDFTLVKPLEDNQEVQMITSLAGTKPFTAPEKLLRSVFGPASDMYSYGVVAFACFVGNINIFLSPSTTGNLPGQESIATRARAELCSGSCYVCNPSERVVNLITNLLSEDMDVRMSAEEVCGVISEILSGYRRIKIKH